MIINEFPKGHLQVLLSQEASIASLTALASQGAAEGAAPAAIRYKPGNPPAHYHLITLLDATRFVEPFDYNAWADTFGWDKVKSADALADADFETLRKLIFTHIRISRFVGGHWEELLASGYLSRFLERLRALYTAADVAA